jgi:hypothetical protein
MRKKVARAASKSAISGSIARPSPMRNSPRLSKRAATSRLAERPVDTALFLSADPALLVPSSVVYQARRGRLRYRPVAQIAQDIDTATCHIGFRLIRRATGIPSY